MNTYIIERYNNKTKQYAPTKHTVEATSDNRAVRNFVVSCKRATKGHATAKSGAKYRAVLAS